MSIEQLIIVVLFVIIPLVQALRQKLAERRGSGRVEREDSAESDELPIDWPPPFEPPMPVPPVQKQPAYVTSLAKPPASLPSVRVSDRPEPMPRIPVRQPPRREPWTHIGLVPSDRQGIRRVMVLMAIFGPPRAMEPYGRG